MDDEYSSLKDIDTPLKFDLSDYVPSRVHFLSEFFLEKFLKDDEIHILAGQIQGNESELLRIMKKKLKLH